MPDSEITGTTAFVVVWGFLFVFAIPLLGRSLGFGLHVQMPNLKKILKRPLVGLMLTMREGFRDATCSHSGPVLPTRTQDILGTFGNKYCEPLAYFLSFKKMN